jgi:DNA-binding transcriptional LysR family regulator
MDPRKLLYLASIIEYGSFKKAAKHLLISQPALSTSMDRLEKSLGGKLLERSPTGITPTLLGELLYSHARLIRDEMDLAEKRIHGSDDRSKDAITFGALPSLITSVVPMAVSRWRASHPTRPLQVVEKVQVELLRGVLRGELDFIIGQTNFYHFLDGLKQRVLFRDRLYVVAHPDHPAGRMKPISWAKLAQFPWICPIVGKQRTLLEILLASDGVALPDQLTECGSVDFVKTLVATSDHLAMLPAHAFGPDLREGRIVPLDIAVPQLNRDIAVIFRERSPLETASRDLVATIEAVGTSLDREWPNLRPREVAA